MHVRAHETGTKKRSKFKNCHDAQNDSIANNTSPPHGA